jgi:hypothetical protein
MAAVPTSDGTARMVSFQGLTGNCAAHLTFKSNDYFIIGGGTHQQWWYQWPLASGGNATYTSFAAWQAVAPGGETNSTTANPSLTSPPGSTSYNGGTGLTSPPICYSGTGVPAGPQPCPTGYVVSSTSSPVIGTGTDLTAAPYSLSIGTKDYYGNTLNHGHGTGYNIGADGGYP